MGFEDRVDTILNGLLNSGSNITYLSELRDKSIEELSKDRDLREVLGGIAKDVEELTTMFLEGKNEFGTNFITGISTGIYLPDYENGSYKYTVLGGTTSRENPTLVDNDTLFDVASITKLYVLVLTFKLEELGLLDLNIPVKDLNPDFQNLGDFTLNDLIRLHGEYRTDGNVAQAESYEEAWQRLKTLYLLKDDRTKNTYNDFGPIVLGNTIEKVISAKLGRNMTLDEIMNEFLFIPLFVNSSKFKPGIVNIAGNANNIGMPHDPKSRNLGGVVASAGIFTNSEGLMGLADGIFDGKYLNEEHVKRLGETTFEGSIKGNMGVYLKDKDLSTTYTPGEFANGSFSHQGWTGSVASYDPYNKIHNNILVNAIEKNDDPEKLKNNKPLGFRNAFGLYQSELVKRIMLMYVVKKYYNKYCNYTEDIEVAHTL